MSGRKKQSGGLFLASDRSGYAARREAGGFAAPVLLTDK